MENGAIDNGRFTNIKFCEEFVRTDISASSFYSCEFINCDFTETSFSEVRFLSCTFDECRFRKIEFKGIIVNDVRGAAFNNCTFICKEVYSI